MTDRPSPLDNWRSLADPACDHLRAAAAAIDPADVAAVDRLRRNHDAALAGLALDLASARRKLALKWPDRAGRLFADPQGAEMASSLTAAVHKAQRFRALLGAGASVLDLCCGIGGDAMGLADAGLRVTGVDADPVRAWMAHVNSGAPTITTDALDPTLPPGWFHLDPARRVSGPSAGAPRRTFRLAEHTPAPEAWRSLVQSRRSGAIKLGPGVDARELFVALPEAAQGELEFLSESGRLTQAVLWTGDLAPEPGLRRATLLTRQRSYTLSGSPGPPPSTSEPLSAWLVEADPSIERADLLGEFARRADLREVWPGLGLLTADAPPPPDALPLCTCFRILDSAPWIEKHARRWLRDHDAGIVEVKTRARAVNPDTLQPALRGDGSTPCTLFVLRFGGTLRAVFTRRAGPLPPAPG